MKPGATICKGMDVKQNHPVAMPIEFGLQDNSSYLSKAIL
jgi:hypothetical protein